MVEEIPLRLPLMSSRDSDLDQKEAECKRVCQMFEEIADLAEANKPIYIKILAGDYAGSIARLIDASNSTTVLTKRHRHDSSAPPQYSAHTHGRFVWDGRKNNIQANIHGNYDPKFAYMRGYEGPTVFEKFDAKKVREEMIANADVRDIHDHKVEVGDEVAYINARYGSGAQLEIGTVDRFEATANSYSRSLYTIIKNGKGEESKLQFPDKQLMKLNHGWDN